MENETIVQFVFLKLPAKTMNLLLQWDQYSERDAQKHEDQKATTGGYVKKKS